MTRNRFVLDEWVLEPMLSSAIFDAFDCKNDDLNEFFKVDAFTNEEELLGKTYILTRDGYEISSHNPPIALVCYCNAAIHINQATDFERKEGVRYYEHLPAAKIARLGVHYEFQGQDIGHLVLNITKSIFLTQNRTGCRILMVDAYKEPRVEKFYEQNEFKRIPNTKKEENSSTWTMYYDLKRFQGPSVRQQ